MKGSEATAKRMGGGYGAVAEREQVMKEEGVTWAVGK
jgi:hypothetical protein